jgi:hypothetical protein
MRLQHRSILSIKPNRFFYFLHSYLQMARGQIESKEDNCRCRNTAKPANYAIRACLSNVRVPDPEAIKGAPSRAGDGHSQSGRIAAVLAARAWPFV